MGCQPPLQTHKFLATVAYANNRHSEQQQFLDNWSGAKTQSVRLLPSAMIIGFQANACIIWEGLEVTRTS